MKLGLPTCYAASKTLLSCMALWLALGHALSHAAETVHIHVDTEHPLRIISPQLTGSHFVYAYERDELYRDERIADWMRRSRVGVIRWPGGTAVQHYHWDDLNGIAFKVDSWDPEYKEKAKSPDDFMDLDEYIAYCRRVGAKPMVGINIRSGKTFNRMQDSLDEARRLIQYCHDKQYEVKYWYIGNECYKGFSPQDYAARIDQYAEVLKSVDPDITIIADWKFGPEKKNRFEQTLQVARESKHIDIMEIHEKWGNEWGLSSGMSVDDWKTEFPLYNGRLAEYIVRFHDEMKKAGREEVKLAFNEWGVSGVVNGKEYDYALVAADFLIELFRNDVAQACYWNLNMGSRHGRVLATKKSRRILTQLNPIADVFVMFSHALGQELLPLTSSTKHVYGFASHNPETDNIQLFLLNKSASESTVDIGPSHSIIHVESFVSPGVIRKKNQGTTELQLDPYSFHRIVMARSSVD